MVEGKRQYHSDLKSQKITVKISEAELEFLDKQASEAKLNRSRYIRELIRSDGGVDVGFTTDRANLIRQIHGVAVNINQVVKVANIANYVTDMDISRLESMLKDLMQLLQEVLTVWQSRKS